MLTLARALEALDAVLNVKPSELALTWNTPLQFDSTLIPKMIAGFDSLESRIQGLIGRIESDPQIAAREIDNCATDLHQLRHTEALRMYPLISHGLTADPVARRLFWQSRLVMLGLARRIFRRFDELARIINNGTATAAAIEHVTRALAEYRHRNEAEIYPLYSLAGRKSAARNRQVARAG